MIFPSIFIRILLYVVIFRYKEWVKNLIELKKFNFSNRKN